MIDGVMDDWEGLQAFFGKPLHRVNQLLLRVAINQDQPEWLRGLTAMKELPRYTDDQLEHQVTVNRRRLTAVETSEMVCWVVEELHGRWAVDQSGFWFEDVKEAIFFKLRWC